MIPVYINIQKGIINCTVFGLHCKAWDVYKTQKMRVQEVETVLPQESSYQSIPCHFE